MIYLLVFIFIGTFLMEHQQEVYKTLDKIRFIDSPNKEVCSNKACNTYKEMSNTISSKYTKGTGLLFSTVEEDTDDGIKDFIMSSNFDEYSNETNSTSHEDDTVELVDYLQDGLYGKIEGENLFSMKAIKSNLVPMSLTTLSDPTFIALYQDTKKEILSELEDCPPLIARHWFGREYTESFSI